MQNQNQEKINEVTKLLGDLTATNALYSDEKTGTYYDYDRVISLLTEASKAIGETAINPRPADLPKDMAWSERFVNPDEEPDPYTYDGSMSPEDYSNMAKQYDDDLCPYMYDSANGPVNHRRMTEDFKKTNKVKAFQDGDNINLKIAFYDRKGKYLSEGGTFTKEELPLIMENATRFADKYSDVAGWTAFRKIGRKKWIPYSADGSKPLDYEVKGRYQAQSPMML